MWRQVTSDKISESLIQLICSNGWFIQEQSKSLRPNGNYPPYLPQIVLQITNVKLRMDSMHIGTQAVTVFMNE